jgi:hypothetical protein
MDTAGLLLVSLVMLVGLVGVVVPLLPGTALVLAAGVAWAVLSEGTGRWVVVGIMAALFAAAWSRSTPFRASGCPASCPGARCCRARSGPSSASCSCHRSGS